MKKLHGSTVHGGSLGLVKVVRTWLNRRHYLGMGKLCRWGSSIMEGSSDPTEGKYLLETSIGAPQMIEV